MGVRFSLCREHKTHKLNVGTNDDDDDDDDGGWYSQMQIAAVAGKFWQLSHGGKTHGCHMDKRGKDKGRYLGTDNKAPLVVKYPCSPKRHYVVVLK